MVEFLKRFRRTPLPERTWIPRMHPRDLVREAQTDAGATPEAIRKEEQAYIAAYRRSVGRGDDGPATFALALSGGGVRSATVALGVMQAFANADKLKKFDYLSTVSGGGYIGSSLTWFTSTHTKPTFGTRKDTFPFGVDPPSSAFQPPLSKAQMILIYLRQHGNFLIPGQGINVFSGVGMVLRGILVNMFIWTPVAITLFLALIATQALTCALSAAAFVLAWVCGRGLLYSWQTGGKRRTLMAEDGQRIKPSFDSYGYRRHFDARAKTPIMLLLGLVLVGLIPVIHRMVYEWAATASMASILAGAVGGFWTFLQSRQSGKGGGMPSFLPAAVAGLLLFGVLVLSFHAAHAIAIGKPPTEGYGIASCYDCVKGLPAEAWNKGVLGSLAAVKETLVAAAERFVWPSDRGGPIVIGIFVWLTVAIFTAKHANLNFTTIHRFYRDRLMESFMPDWDRAVENATGPAEHADGARLSSMCDVTAPNGPYHIINTNVMLNSSQTPIWRQRGGDGFILSPRYCGSSATGWVKTRDWMDDAVTLATAMAVSGAAANPGTGVGGVGPGRNPVVATLMALLNLRLGYWVANPEHNKGHEPRPNHINPTLLELTNQSEAEKARIVQLSDGGHFDNLGLYELVRRKVSLIVISDGGADPDYAFGDLLSVLPRIRADLGTTIEFDLGHKLDWMIPMPPKLDTPRYPNGRHLSERGFAIGRIKYPGGTKPGVLIYLKAAVSAEMDAELLGYKGQIADFPNESTIDQFYSEAKFEAHRGVGYALTQDMMKTVSAALKDAPAESVLRDATLRQFFDLPPLPEVGAAAGAVIVEPRMKVPAADGGGPTGSGTDAVDRRN